jgi:cytochrome c biogenesis factor
MKICELVQKLLVVYLHSNDHTLLNVYDHPLRSKGWSYKFKCVWSSIEK